MSRVAVLLWLTVASGPVPLEANARRQVAEEQPLVVSLLLDNSPSLTPHRPTLLTAVEQFIRTLRPSDTAEVVEFSNNIKVRQQFTSNTGHLLDALTKTALPSGRALYAAVHTRLKALEQFTSQSGCSDCRQAIVFFAAGPDISSAIRANQLLAFVRRSRGVAIYGIAIPANGRSLDRETEFMLRQMAEITGGRAYFPVRFEDLPTVYSHIRGQLTGGSVPGASHATK